MRRTRIVLGLVAAVCLAGCGSSGGGEEGWVVRPGESIQAAVDAAAPGDTVIVLPGDYIEPHANAAAVRVTKPLTLIGKSTENDRVRILPGPGQRHGILVEPENPGDPDVVDVVVSGFTVEGFSNMGIWFRHVDGFVIENNTSIDNLENGIWPILSANGLVRDNVAYGSLDAALWVEGSENVRVIGNDLSFSPTGLEITISNNIHVEGNRVHNNSVGIGLYHPQAAGLPPLLPLERNGFWTIVDNDVFDNNFPNPVPRGSGMVGELPSGGGILLLGVDNVEVRGNRIENNDFFGIAMVDYCLAVDGTNISCSVNPPAVRKTRPEFNKFIDNILTGNGAHPPPGPFELMAGDFLTLGGRDNCASGNVFDTGTFNPVMPDC